MLDLAGSAALLVLLSPLLLLITALIKLTSKGPVLFRQVRISQYEQPFTMLKFRTMHANADQAIHEGTTEFIGSGVAHRAAPAPYSRSFTTRASRDWHFLRRSPRRAPQLWNVLLGTMSLVGPRPPSRRVARYKRWHRRRLTDVRPVSRVSAGDRPSRTTFDAVASSICSTPGLIRCGGTSRSSSPPLAPCSLDEARTESCEGVEFATLFPEPEMTDTATPTPGQQSSSLSGALARERSSRSPAPLRVGVVGYGYWGPKIVRNLSGLDGCELLAVCDKSPASLGAPVAVIQAYS
jgi:hypothetical protein